MPIKNKLKGFKENLPTKICASCGRPFQYRKKWKLIWEKVQFCSKACKGKGKV